MKDKERVGNMFGDMFLVVIAICFITAFVAALVIVFVVMAMADAEEDPMVLVVSAIGVLYGAKNGMRGLAWMAKS